MHERDFFGEGCLSAQSSRISTAGALQRTTVMRLDKKMMVGLLHKKPEFAEVFIAYLLSITNSGTTISGSTVEHTRD